MNDRELFAVWNAKRAEARWMSIEPVSESDKFHSEQK